MAKAVRLEWADPFTANEITSLGGSSDRTVKVNGDVITLESAMIEDFPVEIQSEFAKASQAFGGNIVSQISDFNKLLNAASGSANRLSILFDLQVWQGTQPLAFDFKLVFFTKENPVVDVLLPTLSLMSLTALGEAGASKLTKLSTPGVSFSSLKTFKQLAEKEGDPGSRQALLEGRGKVLSFTIPGFIDLPACILKTAKPMVSKEETESGPPLWVEMQCRVESVYPANTLDLFREYRRLKKKQFGVNALSPGQEIINFFR